MHTAQQLEQLFGVPFHPKDSLTALRQFEHNNAFCLDESGAIIGLCACGNDWSQLELPTEELQDLIYLNLADNESMEDLQFDGPLPSLQWMDVSDGALQSLKIPDGCHQLRMIDASRNQITQWVPGGQFPELLHLDLSNNRLSDFPVSLLDKFPLLQRIYLKENPLPDSKKSFVEQQANCLSFLQYYQAQLERGTVDNKEYKVLLVGNGGVGKTTLVERLVYNRFEENWLSTHGIALEQYRKKKPFDFLLNLWDFGGQDIYHATHRLFMQSNALYLLLWDEKSRCNPSSERTEAKERRAYDNYPLEYWLYYIRQQGKRCPVIVLKTKKSQNNSPHPQRERLQELFQEQFASLEFHQVDSSIDDWSNEQGNGFNKLLHLMGRALKRLRGPEKIPTHWAGLRQHMRVLYRNQSKTISVEEYQAIASDYGFEAEEAMQVLTHWLVPSGVVFHRSHHFNGSIILDQGWAIDAIYTLFNRREGHYFRISAQKGQFTGQELGDIWQDKNYSQAEQELFVRFLLSCEICFELKPTSESHQHIPFAERRFFAPQLMPEDVPASVSYFHKSLRDKGAIYFKSQYSFLHEGVIQRFIVRTQQLAKIGDIWRYGILMEEEGIDALIIARPNEIEVVIPPNGVPLLGKIRKLLGELQAGESKEWISKDGQNYSPFQSLSDSGLLESGPNLRKELKHQDALGTFAPISPEDHSELSERVEKEQFLQKQQLTEEELIELRCPESATVLFLAATPSGTAQLSSEKEYAYISQKVEKDRLAMTYQRAVSLEDMIDAFEEYQPHILHFCGHGKEQEINADGQVKQEGGLIFHSENKCSTVRLSTSMLDRQFRVLKDRFPRLQLVFLNACYSQDQAQAISQHDILSIGTSDAITSEAARKFAAGFYKEWTQTDDIYLGLKGGINRSILADEDIEKLIRCYYKGRLIYPS